MSPAMAVFDHDRCGYNRIATDVDHCGNPPPCCGCGVATISRRRRSGNRADRVRGRLGRGLAGTSWGGRARLPIDCVLPPRLLDRWRKQRHNGFVPDRGLGPRNVALLGRAAGSSGRYSRSIARRIVAPIALTPSLCRRLRRSRPADQRGQRRLLCLIERDRRRSTLRRSPPLAQGSA